MQAGNRALGVAPLLLAFSPAASGAGPNILPMLEGDLGWHDVGHNGSEIRTPAIDRLAAEGLRLGRYYAFPFCIPRRVAIMTGGSPPIPDSSALPRPRFLEALDSATVVCFNEWVRS